MNEFVKWLAFKLRLFDAFNLSKRETNYLCFVVVVVVDLKFLSLMLYYVDLSETILINFSFVKLCVPGFINRIISLFSISNFQLFYNYMF